MHYIRLLRAPLLAGSRPNPSLNLVLTITTDLGESFLYPDEPVELSVIVEIRGDGKSFNLTGAAGRAEKPSVWRAGMRVLKLDLPLSPQAARCIFASKADARICIGPSSVGLAAWHLEDILDADHGLIMPLFVSLTTSSEAAEPIASRRLRISAMGKKEEWLEVEEELGESIARHIWDAGVMTTSFLSVLCLGPSPDAGMVRLRSLLGETRELSVLELGSGVGILGIGLMHILRLRASPPTWSRVLLTDLPAAEERSMANIARHLARRKECDERGNTGEEFLEYENLDWEDGRKSVFGVEVRRRAWDLIILSDCTYNVDMLPALVETLSAIYSASLRLSPQRIGPKMLLATKPRHASEKALFGLMTREGWTACESTVLPLPILGSEDESVEVYLFEKA